VSDLRQFLLPDVGEGLTEGEILTWRVAVGDAVIVNQIVVEIETAKAAVELPSPYAGVITDIHYPAGATVDVGSPIITIDVAPAETAPALAGRTPVLVGYGPKTTSTLRRPRRTSSPLAAPLPAGVASRSVLAKPPVRKLARDLGVDLASVAASLPVPGDIVSREDVLAAVPSRVTPKTGETRHPVTGVRKATARAMVASAFTAPHVTVFMTVDVTRTMKLIRRLTARPEFAATSSVRVSPLVIVARAVCAASRRHPAINASWDEDAQEIVVKHAVNLGIAAATPRGLVVPNIKDAGQLSLVGLAEALGRLTAMARDGHTPPSDMAGGTITITNVGVFGVDAGTPIVNPGEAAILCLGAIQLRPWVHRGKVRPRQVTELSLSFDHRLVDGELGSRFLADIAAALEDPMLMLAWPPPGEGLL
jgi:2-oxoisovalerate dehydrogenase E2 component (dihydrolipoyl transacylase)